MPSLGELVVTLTLSNRRFSRDLEEAQRGTLDFNTAITRLSQSMASVFVKAMAAATGALVAFGAQTIKTGKDFEYAMTEVGAISGAVGEDMERLTERSRELGATTMFTATQAAKGMGELARTGLKTTSILRTTGDALNFAGANSTSVAQSAKLLASTMAQFNLQAYESGRITDVFTTSVQNSLMDVNALTSSMKYGGSIAGVFGHSLEETTASLSLFRNLGLEGSTAGVRFRQAMLSLAKPTAGAEKVLKKYGLTIDDVNPKMHSFAEIMTTLGKKQISLGDMVSLVSKRAAGDVAKIAGEFAAGTTKYTELLQKMMENVGITEETYEKFVNTIQGKSLILQSALQETYITMFEPLKPVLGGFLDYLTSIVRDVSTILNTVPTLLAGSFARSLGGLASGTGAMKDKIVVAILDIIFYIDNIIVQIKSWWPVLKTTATILITAFPAVAILKLSQIFTSLAFVVGGVVVTAFRSLINTFAILVSSSGGAKAAIMTLRTSFLALSTAMKINVVGGLIAVVASIAYYVTSANEATAATYNFEKATKAAQRAQKSWDSYLSGVASKLKKATALTINSLKLQLAQRGKLTTSLEQQLDAVKDMTAEQKKQLLGEGRLMKLEVAREQSLSKFGKELGKVAGEYKEYINLEKKYEAASDKYIDQNERLLKLKAEQAKQGSTDRRTRQTEINDIAAAMNVESKANDRMAAQLGGLEEKYKKAGKGLDSFIKTSGGAKVMVRDLISANNAMDKAGNAAQRASVKVKSYTEELLPLHTALALAKADQRVWGGLMGQIEGQLKKNKDSLGKYKNALIGTEKQTSSLSLANEELTIGEDDKAAALLSGVNTLRKNTSASQHRIEVYKQSHQQLMLNNVHLQDFTKLTEENQKVIRQGLPLTAEQSQALKQNIDDLNEVAAASDLPSMNLYAADLHEMSKGFLAVRDGSQNLQFVKQNMDKLSEGHAGMASEFANSRLMVMGLQDEWEITLDTWNTTQKIMQLQQEKTSGSTGKLTGKLNEQTRALERLIRNYEKTVGLFKDLGKAQQSKTLNKYNVELRKLAGLYAAATREANDYLEKAIQMRKEGKLSAKLLVAAENKALSQRIIAARTAADNQVVYAKKTHQTIRIGIKDLAKDILQEYSSIGANQLASLNRQNADTKKELGTQLDDYGAFYTSLIKEQNTYIDDYYDLAIVQAQREIKNKAELKTKILELDEERVAELEKLAKEQLKFTEEWEVERATIEEQAQVLRTAKVAEHHKKQLDALKKQHDSLKSEQLKFDSERLLLAQKTEMEVAAEEQQTGDYIAELRKKHLLELTLLQKRHLKNTIEKYEEHTEDILRLEELSVKARLEPLARYYEARANYLIGFVKLLEENARIIADLEAKTADGASGVTSDQVAEVEALLGRLVKIYEDAYEKEMKDSFASFLEFSAKGMAKYMQIFGQSLKGEGVVEPLVDGLISAGFATEKALGKIKAQFDIFYGEILNNQELSKTEKSLAMLTKPFTELASSVKGAGRIVQGVLRYDIADPAKKAYEGLKELYEQKGLKGVALEGLKALGVQAGELAVNTGEFFDNMGGRLQEALKKVDFKVLSIKAKAIAKEIYKYSSMIIKSIGSIVSAMAKSLISVGSKVSSYLTGGMSLNPLQILADGVSEITGILEQEAADTSEAEKAIADSRKKFAEGRISSSEMAEAEKEYEYQKSQTGEGEDPKTAQEQASEFVDNLIEKVLATINMIVEVGPTIITKFIQALPQVFNAIAAALPKLITVIMQEGPKLLITIIEGFIAAIPGLVTAIVEQMPAFISSLVTIISEKLPELIQVLTTGVVQLIGQLAEAIPQILDAIFQPAEEGGKSLFETLIEGLTQGLMAVIKALPTIITAILKQLPTIIKTLLASLGDIIGALIDALPEIIDALILALPDIIQALLEGFLILIEKILEILPDLIESLIEMLPKLLEAIYGMIPGLITTLVEALPGIITSLVKLIPVLITAFITLLPTLYKVVIAALPEIIIALVMGIIELFTNPQIMGQLIYALTIGLIGAFIEAGWELIKMLGTFFGDVLTEMVSLGTAETETFGDTPNPIKAGSDGLVARFAPNDYVIAAQRPKDVLNQAMSLLGTNVGSAVNKIAAPRPMIQSPSEMGGQSAGQIIDIAVVAEGKLLSNIQVDAMDKGKAPKLKKKFQRASGATVGFNRGRYNKFGT